MVDSKSVDCCGLVLRTFRVWRECVCFASSSKATGTGRDFSSGCDTLVQCYGHMLGFLRNRRKEIEIQQKAIDIRSLFTGGRAECPVL